MVYYLLGNSEIFPFTDWSWEGTVRATSENAAAKIILMQQQKKIETI